MVGVDVVLAEDFSGVEMDDGDGGAARNNVTAVPNSIVRSWSAGRIETRRMERWFVREP
ncbi:hypothetical protein [Ancrocorticia populi]|uniref:hypothetical protein n=1 Tax=Ancrocorticia populi TaxID=2175228 RepID=UPI0014022068|nr:hypothetical protein [Ancrocorticia populi]